MSCLELRHAALRVAALLLPVLSLAGCDNRLSAPSVEDVLRQSSWTLETIVTGAGRQSVEAPGADRFTVSFGAARGVTARADCNRCSGGYLVDRGSVSIRAFGCTRASCASAPLDHDFVTILTGTSTVQRGHARLILRSSRGRLVFRAASN